MADEHDVGSMEVYCVKCKEKKPLGKIKDAAVQRTGNRYALTGKCSDCTTGVNRFLGKDDPLVKAYQRSEGKPETASVQTVGQTADAAVPEKTDLSPLATTKKRKAGRARKTKEEPDAATGGKAVVKKKATTESPEKPKAERTNSPVKATFPLDIFVLYKGTKYQGRMMDETGSDIRVRGHGKTAFTSLTIAAKACITEGKSVNGWKFWKFKATDGEEHCVDALRNADQRKERGSRPSSGPSKTLMPYSETYNGTYDLPPRDPPLPKRGAAYFMVKKYARHQHLILMTVIEGTLVCVRYNKKGVRQGGVEQLGEFETWKESIPTINEVAIKHGYERVRVQ